PTQFMYSSLLDTQSKLLYAYFPTETQQYVEEIALVVAMQGYGTLDPEQQMHIRSHIRERATVWETDHIKLSEEGKQLIQMISNVTGVPYNPMQDTFYFSTVLNRPEPKIETKKPALAPYPW